MEEATQMDLNTKSITPIEESKSPLDEYVNEHSLSDFDYARNNIRTLIDKSMTAVDDVVAFASDTESPRAYEALSTYLKTLSELNKDLILLNDRILSKDLKVKKSPEQMASTINNNSIYVGSSEELMMLIKESSSSKSILEHQLEVIKDENYMGLERSDSPYV